MYDVVTIGGSTLDIFMKDSEFEVSKEGVDQEKVCMILGDKLLVDDVYFTYGGGGMNTASSFAQLGFNVAYIGSVGDDEIGKGIINMLSERGISDEFVKRNGERKSGLSVALHAGERERTILGYRGANDDLHSGDIPEDISEKTEWLYITHLSGASDMCLEKIAKVVSEKKLSIMWNPGSTQLKKGYEGMKVLLKHTTILNINKEEAEQLAGIEIPRDPELDPFQIDDVSELFERISKMGPEVVVITDGKRGASVYRDGKIFSSQNHDIAKTKDTTGAGDAFGSGFLAGFMKTRNIEEALKWGIIQGGAVITDFGAQNGLLTEERMYEEIKKMK